MSTALVVIAILAVAIGVLSLSQATMGVGVIAIGCFIGILARLAQAAEHNRAAILRGKS
ncbi:hypothetical protein [Xanthomonas campestris]|uniref:hypothetical protein n=1 Tax=Xanthomonas campestris TaxID=339 RepID=UPI0013013A53|nr:hypothetical protein [Xanthomonas campestris]WVL60998.1 hypothetical protein LLE68_000710 [Xanthomonas campestris pv. barbareae]